MEGKPWLIIPHLKHKSHQAVDSHLVSGYNTLAIWPEEHLPPVSPSGGRGDNYEARRTCPNEPINPKDDIGCGSTGFAPGCAPAMDAMYSRRAASKGANA